MGKRARSGSMSGSASAKKRFRRGRYPYARRYRPQYVRPGYGAIGRTPGGGVLGEMKYFDTAGTNKPVAAIANWANTTLDPSTINTLCAPTVGAAYNQRIGKEINVLKIKIRGQFSWSYAENYTTGVQPAVIRYGIFQDMQTNAIQADGNLVMTQTSTPTQAPYIFQNIDNFGRFKVLKDKVCVFQDPNLSGDAAAHDVNGKVHTFKMTVKFKQPMKIRFNNTNGGTIADIIDNSLHFFANSNGGGLPIRLDYLCRVCYKE